jgi:hypothetical protein
MNNKKQHSDIYFNKDVILTFFNDYPPPSALEQEVFDLHADSYFCLNTYDTVWLYRDLKDCLVKHGMANVFKPDNYAPLVNLCIERSGIPELKARKVELMSYFKEFLGMTDEQLAEYSITMLNGIEVF